MKHKILLVDDDKDILDLLKYNLEREGYEVASEKNSLHAVEKAYEFHPDLIILDIMMPKITGFDILQRLQEKPETQQIPVIICSIIDREEAALEAGAAAYIKKPVTREKLRQTIESVVQIKSR